MSTYNAKLTDAHAAFRVSKDLLSIVDEICSEFDLTRSQIFRRSIAEYIKSRGYQRDVRGINETK